MARTQTWHRLALQWATTTTTHCPQPKVVPGGPDLARPVLVYPGHGWKMCENCVRAGLVVGASTDWFWWPGCHQQHAIYVGSWLWLASEIF